MLSDIACQEVLLKRRLSKWVGCPHYLKLFLEWLSAEVKKDTKASDADKTPKKLKNKWRQRILEQEEKLKNEKNSDSNSH